MRDKRFYKGLSQFLIAANEAVKDPKIVNKITKSIEEVEGVNEQLAKERDEAQAIITAAKKITADNNKAAATLEAQKADFEKEKVKYEESLSLLKLLQGDMEKQKIDLDVREQAIKVAESQAAAKAGSLEKEASRIIKESEILEKGKAELAAKLKTFNDAKALIG